MAGKATGPMMACFRMSTARDAAFHRGTQQVRFSSDAAVGRTMEADSSKLSWR